MILNRFIANTTYGDNNNNIANTVTLAGQVFDNYSLDPALGNTGVGQVPVSHGHSENTILLGRCNIRRDDAPTSRHVRRPS